MTNALQGLNHLFFFGPLLRLILNMLPLTTPALVRHNTLRTLTIGGGLQDFNQLGIGITGLNPH
jgi:hypothetical protein